MATMTMTNDEKNAPISKELMGWVRKDGIHNGEPATATMTTGGQIVRWFDGPDFSKAFWCERMMEKLRNDAKLGFDVLRALCVFQNDPLRPGPVKAADMLRLLYATNEQKRAAVAAVLRAAG